MRDALYNVHGSIAVLTGPGKSSKLDKARAVSSISENIANRATSSALSENSVIEICLGPPTPDMLDAGFLSWNGLAVEVLTAMADMCNSAISGRTKTVVVRPEYMTCIRALIKNALSSGPPGVIRSIVPAFFTFMYQWLSEPALRDKLADEIWQTVRDLLLVDDNRAMLSSGFIKTWADVCFEQIIGRGPFYHSSQIAKNLAHEAFMLLAKPTPTFDVLTQSQKGVHSSDMQGLDFGYALLMERCCLMLVLSRSMKERQERHLQSTALQCMTVLLERHCLDFTGSQAAKSVLTLAMPATLALWNDRRYHDCAVESARMLVRLAQCNNTPSIIHSIRERIERDFGRDDGAASVARSYEDINQTKVEVAGIIFSADDALAKVVTKGVSAVHLTAWLRVLTYILEHGGASTHNENLAKDSCSALDFCAHAAKCISELFINRLSEEGGRLPIEVLLESCNVIQTSAETATRITARLDDVQRHAHQSFFENRRAWSIAYSCFLQQLLQIKYANSYRTRRSLMSYASASAAEKPLMDCIVAILAAGLVDRSALCSYSPDGSSALQQSVTWQTMFSDGNTVLSQHAVTFIRAHIGLSGVRDAESPNFRLGLARSLFAFCDPQENNRCEIQTLQNCVVSLLGLSRGICMLSPSEGCVQATEIQCEKSVAHGVDAFISHFCSADIRSDISGRSYVQKARTLANSSKHDLSRCLFLLPNILVNSASAALSSEIVRFNVGKSYCDIIEQEIVQQVLCFLDNLFLDEDNKIEPDCSWFADSAQSDFSSFTTKVKSRYPSLSNTGVHKAISSNHESVVQVAFLIAHYVEQGVCSGSISCDELAVSGSSPISQLHFVLIMLLMKIAATPGIDDVTSTKLLGGVILSCSKIHMRFRSTRANSSSEEIEVASSDLGNDNTFSVSVYIGLLSKIVDNLSKCFCKVIEDKTTKVVDKIKQYVVSSTSPRGSKRPRRETRKMPKPSDGSQHRRKRRKSDSGNIGKASFKKSNSAWSDDSDEDDTAFPQDNATSQFADDGSQSSDLGSDDNVFEQISSPQRSNVKNESGGCSEDRSNVLLPLTELLLTCVQAAPQLNEIVFERCNNCLQQISKLETRLSPDGHSRALIASMLIDQDYLSVRAQLWKVLFGCEGSSQNEDIAKDIVHFGKKWETLEELSFSVVQSYTTELNSGIRNHYPPLECHEKLRLQFLQYSSRLLSRCNPLLNSVSIDNQSKTDANLSPQVLAGIVDIGECFRSRDAFRMPRNTRILYIHFAIVVLSSILRYAESQSSVEMAAIDVAVSKPSQFIHKAICRLMTDCDATVRMACAGAFDLFLKISRLSNPTDVERILLNALPIAQKNKALSVSDSEQLEKDDGTEDSLEWKNWKLTQSNVSEFQNLRSAFNLTGYSAKVVTAIVALGEIAANSVDLLPICVFELLRRCTDNLMFDDISFNVIIRLCTRLDIAGPSELFAVGHRLIFPRWFAFYANSTALSKFPARLISDTNRFRPGGVHDWMRLYNSEILPFILLADIQSPDLSNTKMYCDALGTSMKEILENNVSSFSRLFPLMFTGGFDHDGRRLWNAIDDVLESQSSSVVRANREEVQVSLLLSISAGNSFLRNFTRSEQPHAAFWRDCRETNPPYYDSLVIASSLNRLYGNDDKETAVWRRRDLQGSLFASSTGFLGSEELGNLESVAKGIVKKSSTVISILLAVWKLFNGPPGPVHPQNRIDAIFITGTIWNISGKSLLLESNRRRLLFKLVLHGFRYPETVYNALWLLRSIAEQTVQVVQKDEYTLHDLFMDENLAASSDVFASSSERRMFELIYLALPTLVQVSLGEGPKTQKRAAIDGLLHLMQTASEEEMWAPLASVDMIPNAKCLKEARKLQEKAASNALLHHRETPLSQEMRRFIVSERRCSDSSPQLLLSLSRLRRLRHTFSESNRTLLSKLIHEESWLRSEGRSEKMLNILNEILGLLVDINHSTSSHSTLPRMSHVGNYSQSNHSLADNLATGDYLSNTRGAIIQECTWLLGKLGTIYPTALVFESSRHRLERRINPLQITGSYETEEDGIKKTLPLLRQLIFNDSPLIAQVAYNTLIAVLTTREGKAVLSTYIDELKPINEFRSIARKSQVSSGNSTQTSTFFDSETGEAVQPAFLCLTNEELWSVPNAADTRNDRPEDFWVKRLTATLAYESQNSAFNKMAPACFVSIEFARTLFPYLLMNLIDNADCTLMSVISRLITNHVLSDSSASIEAARIMIHGLDSLCQLQLASMGKKGVGSIYQDDLDQDIPFLYHFSIPYMLVAATAARVGMYFSATRYATLYIERETVIDERERIQASSVSGKRGGARRLSSLAPAVDASSLVKDNAQRAVEHILILVSENINEPDMSRGLGQHGDLLTTASHMAVLDSDWGRSVGTLDTLCHRQFGIGSSNLTSGDREHSGFRVNEDLPSRELMLINSLNGLGCPNIIAHYWDILKRKVSSDQLHSQGSKTNDLQLYLDRVEKLNEQRFSAAWKLGDWEVPDLIVPDVSRQLYSKPIAGLHQTIHKVLSTLSTGDVSSVIDAIQSGRESQAIWLGQMVASESAQRVYQVADRVHALNEIESAVFAMAKTRSGEVQGVSFDELSRSFQSEPGSSQQLLLDLTADQLGHTLSNLLGNFSQNIAAGKQGSRFLGGDFFGSSEYGLDLRIAMTKCLGSNQVLARMAADVSKDIFAKGGSGAWARAASALGNPASVALSDTSEIDCVSWRLQESKLRWAASQDGKAKQIALLKVQELIENNLGGSFRARHSKSNKSEESFQLSWTNLNGEQDRIAIVRAEACQLVASWSAEMRAEEPMILFKSYLEMGLKSFDQAKDKMSRGHMHYFMAEFADKQIASIDNYRKTKKYDQMVLAVEKTEKKVSKLEAMKENQMPASGSSSGRRRASHGKAAGKSRIQRDLELHIRNQKKKLAEDKVRLRRLDAKYIDWQLLACRHYASSIRDGSTNDLRGSFRLVALWLDSGPMRARITSDLVYGNANDELCVNVPLSKLLPLFPQLSSRLGGGSDSFQVTLSATLETMAAAFPSHCLWQLLALSNSTRVSGTDEKLSSFYRGDKGKKGAADTILARLQSSGSGNGSSTIRQMKAVADAYINLSETPSTSKKGKKSLNISRSPLCQLRNISDIPVPTTGLPLYGHTDPNFSPPYISRFEGEARVCSGLSMPLRIICIGSDGHRYAQLVKGKDDLRGDAVMEQMFTILNELLRRDTEAARRSLLVRTYRIVPLSPFSGIMQFVTDTEPFASVLVLDNQVPGERSMRKSLHERYRPHDMTHANMRDGAFQFAGRSDMSKKIGYLALNWHRIQPVFRYFFLEQWPDPADWFSHQLAYTRSVAVMSIVGFVLGIGDRHLSNILLDTASGEVVHIDFGIAFEQGKLLPTPELMPFRLTRDMVDGFGVSGVDGAFRRCSEVTLQVLRRNKDVLLTVFEVLLHDPMFNWALSPEEVLREQLQTQGQNESGNSNFGVDSGGESADIGSAQKSVKGEEGSEEAQRALRRIAEKLDGMEDTERLSVEAHVARLIDDARAFQVLASVYPGWSPWYVSISPFNSDFLGLWEWSNSANCLLCIFLFGRI